MTGRLVVVALGWALYSLVKSQLQARRLLGELLTHQAVAEDLALRLEERSKVDALLTAPDVLWSPQDVDGARAHGIDLSRVYEDDRHRGDVL